MSAPDDFKIARAQFIKTKRVETRHRFALMADAEIARNVDLWGAEFDAEFMSSLPEVLDLQSELRRLTLKLPS